MTLHSFAASPPIASSIFAALSGLLVLGLGLHTSLLRLRLRIFAGDGGNEALRRASRAHGLAVEHVILMVLLLVLLELQGAPRGAIVALGSAILVARAIAAAGTLGFFRSGISGATLTYLIEFALPAWLLANVLRG